MKVSLFALIATLFLFNFSPASVQSIDAVLDVGHHSLHFRVVPGKGRPILFEAGNGDDGSVYGTEFARRNKFEVEGAVFIEPAVPCSFTPEWAKEFTDSTSESDWAMIKQVRQRLYYVLRDLDRIAERMARRPLPSDIPLTVVAAEQPQAMLKPEETALWAHCLKEFGEAANHRYVLAGGCGHKVWQDDPEVVITEIVAAYRKANP